MTRISDEPIIDQAELTIRASPDAVYAAFIDPQQLAKWLPPGDMTCRIDLFQPWPGGRYRMTLRYREGSGELGKSGEHSDVVEGRFLDLVPGERVEQEAVFQSSDPAFAGVMRIIWTFGPVSEGSRVAVRCEDVPTGISAEDHDAGLHSSLANLAAAVETRTV